MAYAPGKGGHSGKPKGRFRGPDLNDPAYRNKFKDFFDSSPEQGEFVMATVKKIMPYGAFCTLEEYEDREAFIHVSEVASRWVKNIHEFVKEGQKIVARVHRLVPEKNQVDLSLRRVTDKDRKVKMEAYKREKRAYKLFEMCAKKMKEDPEKALEDLGESLIKKHGDLPTAWEAISFTPDTAFKGLKVSAGWKDLLVETAQQNIKKPEVFISGTITVISQAPDGVELIKKALKNASKAGKKDAEVEISYLGAPHYHLLIKAEDYKTAEKALEDARSEAEKALGGNGVFSFERAESS